MAAFETLLNRFCAQPRVLDDRLDLEAFARRDRDPALERAWLGWAQSQRALRQGDPRLGLMWLSNTRDLVEAPEDRPLAAEQASAELRCWMALDEPKAAAGPAEAAWRLWSSMAAGPAKDEILPSAQALLKILSDPHPPPPLLADDVFAAWLADRLAPNLLGAAQRAMQVYADHRCLEPATEVAGSFLEWQRRFAPTGAAGRLSGLVTARLLLTLGDVHDRCGDPTGSLAVFEDGLKQLAELPDLPEIQQVRGQLRFNIANQLSKLGRHGEALKALKAANGLLATSSDPETLLRGRYAICAARFRAGDLAGLEDELAELAGEYEQVVAGAREGTQVAAARQGLDRVYRLWLRLMSAAFDGSSPSKTLCLLHLVFALKEEDGKFAGIWRQVQARPQADLLSEVTVLLDRAGRRGNLGILVIEQAVDALVVVSVRPGETPWIDRVRVQLMDDRARVADLETLIIRQGEVLEQLNIQAIPTRSEADAAFMAACTGAWQALDPGIREDIAIARTLMVTLDSQTDLSLLPVELFHDGQDHIGLSKDILRAPSLRDLNLLLCENRTNARPTGRAIVLRADDDLAMASMEVGLVEDGLARLGVSARILTAPSVALLLDELGAGVDLLHYVGHGLADPIGEELPLGPSGSLPARDLERLHPAPAPVAVLSACLIGRGRQLRTGEEQGFATQLLRRGSPAVIAATYRVPDALAVEVSELLYNFMTEQSITSALRATRQALAEDQRHPAAWAAFVIFGRPDVRASAPHAGADPGWPSLVLRYLATGAEDDLRMARSLVENDQRLTPACRAEVIRDLSKLASSEGHSFEGDDLPQGLEAYAEARIACSMIHVFGSIRHGSNADPVAASRRLDRDLAQALVAADILGDTYLLVATAAEMRRRTLHHLGDQKGTALRARRRLRWLSGDDAKLGSIREIISA